MAEAARHRAAEALLQNRLNAVGAGFERLTELPDSYAVLLPGNRMLVAKVLVRAGPHPRGHSGALGMHWMLRSDLEDLVALVDTTRGLVWILRSGEFRERARLQKGGRWHLDWLVSPGGRTQWSQEADFADFEFDRALPRLAKGAG